MKTTPTVFVTTLLLALPLMAGAEDRVVEIWNCALKEGKTLDDAKQVNSKWVKFQNEANPGAGVRSFGLGSIVGETGEFKYLDSFPTLDAWTKSKAAIATPAGVALEAELTAIADCSSNRLYQAIEH